MIVDTSALLAIVMAEPDADHFRQKILQSDSLPTMSAASYLEAGIVIDGRKNPSVSRDLDWLIDEVEIEIVDITVEHAKIARAAYRDYGKGSGHKAQLNFGDCFSYALASQTREPILFKGNDFSQTDLQSA